MKRSYSHPTAQDAKEAACNILREMNRERGYNDGKPLSYVVSALRLGKLADSFKETGKNPVTPFDTPKVYEEEVDYFHIQGIEEETGSLIGGVAYVYKNPLAKEPRYLAIALYPEETDPNNYTLPFKNLNTMGVIYMSMAKVRFYKPVRPISLSEVMTKEGQTFLRSYMTYGETDFPFYWDYDFTKEELSKGNLDKSLFLEPHPDPDIEDDPDENDEDWLDNMVNFKRPHPSILSEATGIKISNAKDYLKAFQKIFASPLDKREKRAVIKDYAFFVSELLLDYAVYEFFRTESYSHLQEILSHYADFGLPVDWAKGLTRLTDYNPELRKLEPLSVEEYIVSLYIRQEYSYLVCSYSYKEISESTGIPLSLIYRASKRNADEF